jgi:hypothetical protein
MPETAEVWRSDPQPEMPASGSPAGHPLPAAPPATARGTFARRCIGTGACRTGRTLPTAPRSHAPAVDLRWRIAWGSRSPIRLPDPDHRRHRARPRSSRLRVCGVRREAEIASVVVGADLRGGTGRAHPRPRSPRPDPAAGTPGRSAGCSPPLPRGALSLTSQRFCTPRRLPGTCDGYEAPAKRLGSTRNRDTGRAGHAKRVSFGAPASAPLDLLGRGGRELVPALAHPCLIQDTRRVGGSRPNLVVTGGRGPEPDATEAFSTRCRSGARNPGPGPGPALRAHLPD